ALRLAVDRHHDLGAIDKRASHRNLRTTIARDAQSVQSMINMVYIHRVNLAALDLNLLVALDALPAEVRVAQAGRRPGLWQPAASHALARLRALFGDPLLVRVGSRMELTPRAQALKGPTARALDQVRGLFSSDVFDPATSARRFLLMMPDL